MPEKIAAALLKLVCDVAEQRYGIAPGELLDAGALAPNDLRNLSGLLPVEAFEDMLRFLLERTGDPALGLRMADVYNYRTQGFWGYAVLSCLTLRECIELQIRYLPLRAPARLSLWIDGQLAFVELTLRHDPDLTPVLTDFAAAGTLTNSRRLQPGPSKIDLWLPCREQPHHRELRAMARGALHFGAPHLRSAFPARDLDQRIGGDPHLGELIRAQLDAQLAQVSRPEPGSVLEDVRQRLLARLAGDASLERVARDLRVSARTLRRQLSALGASFQELLEEVRRSRAIAYLAETNDPIEQVASRLGYGDPSNFRRAFRRWMGISPTAFRVERRAGAPHPSPTSDPPMPSGSERADASTSAGRRRASSERVSEPSC